MSLGLILRILIVILIARMLWRIVAGLMRGTGPAGTSAAPRTPVSLVRDPVCGTYVVPSRRLSVSAADGIHYFCSEQCRREYGARRG